MALRRATVAIGVMPGAKDVIPDSIRDPVQEFVIPDSIRDPVPRVDWIADQVRNDNSEVCNDNSDVIPDSIRDPVKLGSDSNYVYTGFIFQYKRYSCTFERLQKPFTPLAIAFRS